MHINESKRGIDWDYGSYIEKDIFAYGDQQTIASYYRPLLLNQIVDDTDYDLRIVLTWTSQQNPMTRDLDLFVEYQINDRFICNVGFYLPSCLGAQKNYEF